MQGHSKLFLVLILLVFISSSCLAGDVSRSFDNNVIEYGDNVTVSLKVSVKAESFYAVDETIPEGWAIVDADGGDTSQKQHIKWVVISDAQDVVYTYVLKPDKAGFGKFYGEFMFEGQASATEISGPHAVSVEDPWYNDKTANDTCLSLVSDRKLYRPGPNGTFEAEFKVQNSCGSQIAMGSLAVLFEGTKTSKTSVQKVEIATGFKDQTLMIEKDPAKGYEPVIIKVPDYKTVTPLETTTYLDFSEKAGFEKSRAFTMTIPSGSSYLKLTLAVPFEDGEFVVTLLDQSNGTRYSTLDPFYSGSGSAADPYILTTCQHLQDLAPLCNDATIFFELGQSIDCSAFGNFTPICVDDANTFKGHLDGKGFTITGLTVNVSSGGAGLFSSIGYGGSVTNLGLIDFNIWDSATSGGPAGALGGTCGGCDVNKVYVTGATIATASNAYAGGIFGAANFSGDGLWDSNVTNCYATDSVVYADAASSKVGGLFGGSDGCASGPVCYSTYKNNYSTVEVHAAAGASGITGYARLQYLIDINGNYWDTQTSGTSESIFGSPQTTAAMKQQTTYDANKWDFVEIWQINEGVSYPTLQGFSSAVPNVVPDINVVYPNGGEVVSGTTNIDFNVIDPDFNTLNAIFDANFYADNKDNNTTLTIATDVNLLAGGVCPDTNFLNVVTCSYSYNFNDLNIDTNYMIRISIEDDSGGTASDFSDGNFTISAIQSNLTIFSRANLDDLTEDGVNFGEDSEAWEQSEDKTRGLNAINVNQDQLLVVKALNDNTTLTVYVNNNSIGTIDSNASDPQYYQLYAFDVSSAYLTANPQQIRIIANGTQATTYVDFISFIDITDSNYASGGKDVAVLWDVNYNSNPSTRNAAVLQQGDTQTIVDANIVSNSKGQFMAVFEDLASTDQNIQAWIQVISSGTKYESDTNKTIEVDATNPVINSITMTLNVVANRIYTLDSNITEKNYSSATLTIEGIPYDLNGDLLVGNDVNTYGDFNFTASGAYSCVLAVYDAVDRNATYPFTVNSSVVNMTQNAEDQNSNWSRANAIDINSTLQYVDVSFRSLLDIVGTGTANITDYDFNYTLYNGTSEADVRGAVYNTVLVRENKSTYDMTDNQLVHLSLISSDINGNSTVQDIVQYDVNDAIEVQWKNTGAGDQRLIYVNSVDHNTTLTDFWVKVEIRSPFDPAASRIYFKECVEGIDFAGGTCTSYNVYDIYDQSDTNFNGGSFPTEDSDDDGLKDVIYFKVSSLSEHMYSIDNTATAEPSWTGGGGSGGGGGGGSHTSSIEEETEGTPGEEQTLDSGFFGLTFLGDFAGGIGELIGAVIAWAGLQYTRAIAQGLFTGENIFTIAAFVIILLGVFIFIPAAERKASQKNFGVRV